MSTEEGYMPALYEQGIKWMHVYPLGLGKAEYLVVHYRKRDNVLRWQGFVSYLGPAVVEETNSCLQNRVNEKYTLIRDFPDSQSTGTAILQRR